MPNYYGYEYGNNDSSDSTGKKKDCDKCAGKGRVNGRYEKVWRNVGWCPADNEQVEEYVSDECPECKGKGYKELKWV